MADPITAALLFVYLASLAGCWATVVSRLTLFGDTERSRANRWRYGREHWIEDPGMCIFIAGFGVFPFINTAIAIVLLVQASNWQDLETQRRADQVSAANERASAAEWEAYKLNTGWKEPASLSAHITPATMAAALGSTREEVARWIKENMHG